MSLSVSSHVSASLCEYLCLHSLSFSSSSVHSSFFFCFALSPFFFSSSHLSANFLCSNCTQMFPNLWVRTSGQRNLKCEKIIETEQRRLLQVNERFHQRESRSSFERETEKNLLELFSLISFFFFLSASLSLVSCFSLSLSPICSASSSSLSLFMSTSRCHHNRHRSTALEQQRQKVGCGPNAQLKRMRRSGRCRRGSRRSRVAFVI